MLGEVIEQDVLINNLSKKYGFNRFVCCRVFHVVDLT